MQPCVTFSLIFNFLFFRILTWIMKGKETVAVKSHDKFCLGIILIVMTLLVKGTLHGGTRLVIWTSRI
jgi:hypothetical protein